MEQSQLIDTLAVFFAEKTVSPDIRLAYLFGSRAQGSAGPISDYDVAVLFSNSPHYDLRYKLAYDLNKAVMRNQVDLVVLNSAPIELRYAVIASGIVVYESNFEVRVEYEAVTLSLYGDYLPILRRQRKEILFGG